jgi:hypothetical protein
MEDSKYYTPNISEFYPGFEYEMKERFMDGVVKTQKQFDESNWISCIYTLGEGPYLERTMFGNNPHSHPSAIRVKYLDKEDIESVLNIKPFLGGSYVFEKDCNFRPDWLTGVYVSKIRIYFHPENTWVRIEYLIEKEWEKFFEGSLKNKSELKNLLVWLGITHQV